MKAIVPSQTTKQVEVIDCADVRMAVSAQGKRLACIIYCDDQLADDLTPYDDGKRLATLLKGHVCDAFRNGLSEGLEAN